MMELGTLTHAWSGATSQLGTSVLDFLWERNELYCIKLFICRSLSPVIGNIALINTLHLQIRGQILKTTLQ